MPSIFTRIIRGEIPCHKLREDERFIAFLDIRPINPGHALVVPKLEVDYLFDLPDDLLRELLIFARPVAAALKAELPCLRIGMIVAGLEVPHAHLHLVPINGEGELSFAQARPADQAELKRLAAAIRARL
jgi:histidine triad (HIT) family protein